MDIRGAWILMAGISTLLFAGSKGQSAPVNPDVLSTIQQMAAEYDPRKEPLEIEMIKEWDEGNVHYEQLYFTGEIVDGVKTRIYAYRGAPKSGSKLPGVLYCHGGGQTAYLHWVRFWATRGYVCVSFDFSGDTNKNGLPEYRREHFTRWGEPVEKMMTGAGKPATGFAPKYDSWYHFVAAARRSLTLLENYPRMNPDKIGAYGVSAGGYMCWLLAAQDKRVKTIVPIYGAGAFARDADGKRRPITADSEAAQFREAPGNPVFYAPLVTVPTFYMTATNDGSFNLDHSFDTIDRTPAKTLRLLYTPRNSHHMEPPESPSLPKWMEWQLKGKGEPWPETPRIEVTAGRVPKILTHPARTGEIKSVSVYYCLNNSWALSRFWRDGQHLKRQGDVYVAEAPFMNPGDTIYAFANIAYKSGMVLSSRIVFADTASMTDAKPTLQHQALIDTMETPRHWNWVPAYPDPKLYESYFRQWKGPAGEKAFTVRPFECDNPPFVTKEGIVKYNFGTLKIGDPQWGALQGDKALLIDCYVPMAPIELSVHLGANAKRAGSRDFTAKPPIPQGSDWVTLRMEQSDFKDAEGKPMSGWENLQFLNILGTSTTEKTPVFRNARWDR